MYTSDSLFTPEQMPYTQSFLCDTIKFTQDNMRLYMNDHSVDLPLSVFAPLKDKFRAGWLVARDGLDLQFMIKQGTNWYSLTKTAESK